MNINRVILTGNLTRDPELRTLPSGASICDITIAVNESTKVNGEWTKRANFFNISAFGKTAENSARYLSKGRQVAVEGRLRFDSWEKDGQKRTAVKVLADNIQFIGGKNDAEQTSAPNTSGDAFDKAKDFLSAAAEDNSDLPW